MFYFSLKEHNKKENINKFIISGVVLILLSLISIFFRELSVRLISYSVAFLFLFISYLNLLNINERRRYQSKKEVRPFVISQVFLILIAITFIIFPTKIQASISIFFGVYILVKSIFEYIRNKNNPYYIFSFSKVFSLLVGIILIISPLFLSKFIISIMSFLIFLIGTTLTSFGFSIKRKYID